MPFSWNDFSLQLNPQLPIFTYVPKLLKNIFFFTYERALCDSDGLEKKANEGEKSWKQSLMTISNYFWVFEI